MKLLLAALALTVLAPAPSDELAFAPKEGLELEKRFEVRMTMEKRSMSMSMGGRELPAQLTENAVFDRSMHVAVVVEDEYKKLSEERPLELVRKFTKLQNKEASKVQMVGMPEPKEENEEKESKLLDRTVLFRWDGKKDAYAKEWVGDGADDALLEELEEDMDLRALLPGKAVAEGDSWELDVEEFADLFEPGGDLGFPDDDDEDDDAFEENMKGKATCTYKGTKEVDGRKLARIAAEWKATTHQDQEKEGGTMHMEFVLTLEGEFLWDVAAGHLASYELSGEVDAKLEMKQTIAAQGQEHELKIEVGLGGPLEMEGEFTKR